MNNVFGVIGGLFKRLMQGLADYTRETNKTLLFLCILASIMGCSLIFSATHYTGSVRQVLVQFGAILIGLFAAVAVSIIDYKTLTKHPTIFIAITVILLAITFQFGYSPEGSENKAWISLPMGMSLQVSEIIKICMILTFSYHVQSIKKEEINQPKNIVLLAIHGIASPALVMVLQKDLGTVIIMLFIFISMLFAAGVKARYFIIGFASLAAVSPVLWFFGLSEYQRQRFSVILDLESDAKGLGYQQLQGLKAIGSGGFIGEGYLKGTYIQSGAVPKSYNDFIFSVAGEEFGLLGCLVIVAVLVAILIQIMRIGSQARDVQGKIICAGAFGMFASQMVINLGMVLSVMPVIGVTLPFFSAGGSSLVVLYVSIGLVLSVYKNRFKRQVYLRDS